MKLDKYFDYAKQVGFTDIEFESRTTKEEIDNKIVMFCVSHISDYNYALNVILLEGSSATQIRTDIFAPQRKFEITEGHVFSSM